MKRFRFHLGSLVTLVLVLGIGLAALRESNAIWDSSIFSVAVGVLSMTVLLAIHRTEKKRAFWIGFALFGWVHLGLSVVPSIEPRLITTKGLAYLDSKVPGRSTIIYATINRGIGSGTGNNQVTNVTYALDGMQLEASGDVVLAIRESATGKLLTATGRLLGGWSGTTENFVKIGHSLFALLLGWLGGQLSRRLYRSSRSSEPTSAVEPQGTPP